MVKIKTATHPQALPWKTLAHLLTSPETRMDRGSRGEQAPEHGVSNYLDLAHGWSWGEQALNLCSPHAQPVAQRRTAWMLALRAGEQVSNDFPEARKEASPSFIFRSNP